MVRRLGDEAGVWKCGNNSLRPQQNLIQIQLELARLLDGFLMMSWHLAQKMMLAIVGNWDTCFFCLSADCVSCTRSSVTSLSDLVRLAGELFGQPCRQLESRSYLNLHWGFPSSERFLPRLLDICRPMVAKLCR